MQQAYPGPCLLSLPVSPIIIIIIIINHPCSRRTKYYAVHNRVSIYLYTFLARGKMIGWNILHVYVLYTVNMKTEKKEKKRREDCNYH